MNDVHLREVWDLSEWNSIGPEIERAAVVRPYQMALSAMPFSTPIPSCHACIITLSSLSLDGIALQGMAEERQEKPPPVSKSVAIFQKYDLLLDNLSNVSIVKFCYIPVVVNLLFFCKIQTTQEVLSLFQLHILCCFGRCYIFDEVQKVKKFILRMS